MIRFENITKQYAGRVVLNLPSLEIGRNESVGITGNNGAGKTTMLSLISDLVKPDSGGVFIKNERVGDKETWKLFSGIYLDETFLPSFLSPEEYFAFIAELKGVERLHLEEQLALFKDFFGGEVLNKRKYIRELSKGNAKKAGIAGAFIGSSELIILDEPFANLDPTSQFALKEVIRKYREHNDCTILISSHDLDQVTEISTRIISLSHGEIIFDDQTGDNTLEDLKVLFRKSMV